MATTTTNLGLTKPAGTEAPDISVINTNMDKIDTASGLYQKLISGQAHVSDSSVATVINALVQAGHRSGHVFFAGTSNTGLPEGQATGLIVYWSSDATSAIIVQFISPTAKKAAFGQLTSTTVTWGAVVG